MILLFAGRWRLARTAPAAKDEREYSAQLTAEKAIRKYVKGRGAVREWVKLRERNEALDLEVYALAALYILGPAWIQALGQRAEALARPLSGPLPPVPDQPQVRMPSQMLRRPRRGWVNRW